MVPVMTMQQAGSDSVQVRGSVYFMVAAVGLTKYPAKSLSLL